jgi:hypothetical protein
MILGTKLIRTLINITNTFLELPPKQNEQRRTFFNYSFCNTEIVNQI